MKASRLAGLVIWAAWSGTFASDLRISCTIGTGRTSLGDQVRPLPYLAAPSHVRAKSKKQMNEMLS